MSLKLSRTFAVTLLSIVAGAPGMAKTIKMVSVVYGTPESGKTCDATQTVAGTCNGKHQCNVDVSNGSLCSDPDFLSVKKAVIDFKCGRDLRRIVEGEYRTAKVSCD